MLLSPSPAWAACVWHAATLACCDCLYHPITLFAQSLCIHSILALLAAPLQQDPSGLEQNAPWKQSPEFFPRLQRHDEEGMSRPRPPPPTTPGHPGEGLTVLMGNGRFSGPFRQNPRMCQGNALRLELKHPPTSPPVQGLSKLPRGQLLGLPGLSSQLFTGELEQNNGSLKRNPGHSLWERWRHLGQGLRMGKIKLRR